MKRIQTYNVNLTSVYLGVVALLLCIVIAYLGRQNADLKTQLTSANKVQTSIQQVTKENRANTDRIINYFQCTATVSPNDRSPDFLKDCINK